jgi:nucleoid-associated protein EbfC
MFKELSQLAALMKQAQGMSGKMQEMKDRMAALRCEGQSGGGMVTVEVNGQMKVIKCHIDPALMQSGDREMLEDLVCAAANQALDKIRESQMNEMQQLTGGLNIPGLNMPGLGDAFAGMGPG